MKLNNATGAQLKAGSGGKRSALIGFVVSGFLAPAVATQVAAAKFHYAAQLGFNVGHVYEPFAIFGWMGKWGNLYPALFKSATVSGGVVFLVCLLVIALWIKSKRVKIEDVLHGSAQWAQKADLQRSGLLTPPNDEPAVFVGAWKHNGKVHYLRHSGLEHVMAFAPTRSGKGVGLVIPTLLSWTESAVVTDLKGELFALTAGWRQKYARNPILKFEPADVGSVRFNPLREIRIGTKHEIGDVQNFIKCLVDTTGKGTEEDHFAAKAESLLMGVILHALYLDRNASTMEAIDAMLSSPDRSVKELWSEMIASTHLGDSPHPVVAAVGRDMLDTPDREGGSIVSTAKKYFALFRDPMVARNTAVSDFRVADLMHADSPVTLYIITQPTDKERLKPLVRLVLTMILRILAEKQAFVAGRAVASYKHRMLLMLDEFPSFGKLDIMQESLAFIAGYGMKAYLIVQDLNQLHAAYGKNESITSQCTIQVCFPPNRMETAEHISKLTGITTHESTQISRNAMDFAPRNRTVQRVQRPLLTADEAMRLPTPIKDEKGDIKSAGAMLVFVTGFPAIYGVQPLYFQDEVFRARAKVSAPEKSDKIGCNF